MLHGKGGQERSGTLLRAPANNGGGASGWAAGAALPWLSAGSKGYALEQRRRLRCKARDKSNGVPQLPQLAPDLCHRCNRYSPLSNILKLKRQSALCSAASSRWPCSPCPAELVRTSSLIDALWCRAVHR